MMCSRDLPEEDIQVAASSLKTIFYSDSKLLRELVLEVKHLKSISKTFHVSHTCISTIKEVQHRLMEIDKSLLDVCLISEELCQLQNICHHGDEDTPDPEKLYPDTYSTLIELMAQYEANCRQKEDLENLINQVHMKLLKTQVEPSSNQSKSKLHHSNSLDSHGIENTRLNTSAGHRRQSADSNVPFRISLFPELSQETLKIAQQEYHKLRPLQPYQQQGALQKQASSAGPIRIQRSPLKSQENVSVYSPVQQCTSCSSSVSLIGSLSRVRSPVYRPAHQYTACPSNVSLFGSLSKVQSPVHSPAQQCTTCSSSVSLIGSLSNVQSPVYSPAQQYTSCSSNVSLFGSLSRVRSPVLTSFLKKEREKNCLEDITNLNIDKS